MKTPKTTKKISNRALAQARIDLAAMGGKARAAKYDKATLRAWGKKGGRPKKSDSNVPPRRPSTA